VLERHLALPHALGDGSVARVEALEARVPVVVTEGVVEVEQQLAAELESLVKNQGAVESRRPSWSRVEGAVSRRPTAITSAMPSQRGQERLTARR
jgi:hypothetical protein